MHDRMFYLGYLILRYLFGYLAYITVLDNEFPSHKRKCYGAEILFPTL